MKVKLETLQPNPMRDFTVDPIDDDRVKELAESIKEDGFWGGVVCRHANGNGIQIAAGHHRVKAALKAGVQEADVYAGDMDDEQMIRIYARENALQRGNTSTALAGSVAAAVRFKAKQLFIGDSSVGNPTDEIKNGIGWTSVLELLDGSPGVNRNTVNQQLANLKASGDYGRIIREVEAQIEKENRERLEALERAEREQTALAEKEKQELEKLKKTRDAAKKAADKASKHDETFDFAGVAKYLKTPSHVDVFRKLATGKGVTNYLPVNQQAALAREIVTLADGKELSGRFIRENFMSMVMGVKQTERKLNAKEKADLAAKDWSAKARVYQGDMGRGARTFLAGAVSLAAHCKKRPKGVTLQATSEFQTALKNIKKAVALLESSNISSSRD